MSNTDSYENDDYLTDEEIRASLSPEMQAFLAELEQEVLQVLAEEAQQQGVETATDALANSVDRLADAYDPSEPRKGKGEGGGEWTGGGGGGGAEPAKAKPKPQEEPLPSDPMAKAGWILEKAKKAVADVGYDPERVFLSTKAGKFKVGDTEYMTGGEAFTRAGGLDGGGAQRQKGDIVIYGQPDFAKDFPVRGIAVHEAMHQKWQTVLDYSNSEPIAREGRVLTPGPVAALINPFLTKKSQALEDNDGVSSYSQSYWGARMDAELRGSSSTVSFGSAVHETLAEIARIQEESAPNAPLNELTKKPIAKVWVDFYSAVNQAWDMIRDKPPIDTPPPERTRIVPPNA
jgi:hypothetical protein